MATAGGASAKEENDDELPEEVVRLGNALAEPDAAMNLNAYNLMREYQAALQATAAEGAPDSSVLASVQKLASGYRGYAQITRLMGTWLEDVSPGEEQLDFMVRKYLRQAIVDNFDVANADKLIDSKAAKPAWLHTLSQDAYWRTMLIELFDAHRNSFLLRLLLKEISTQGHHREIAAIVSVADIFHVFSGVLQDQLGQIPLADGAAISGLLPDLQRMCCSTAYMYMYSQELLRQLEVEYSKGANGSVPASLASVCASKYRRLRQELIVHSFRATDTISDKRASFATKLNECQRHEIRESHPEFSGAVSKLLTGTRSLFLSGANRVEAAVAPDVAASLVSCLGLEGLMNSPAKDGEPVKMMGTGVETGKGEGVGVAGRPPVQALRHPVLMELIMEGAFHPSHRSPRSLTRHHCCCILAYASCVEVGWSDSGEPWERVDMTVLAETSSALIEVSDLCLDNRLGHHAKGKLHGNLKPALATPVASYCLLFWVRVQVTNPAFCSTPNFLTCAPLFLWICRIAGDSHPAQRPQVLAVLSAMVQVDPQADMGVKSKLKEQILLLMVHLMAGGYVIEVIDFITDRAGADGVGRLDAQLLRFVVGHVMRMLDSTQKAEGTGLCCSVEFLGGLSKLLAQPRAHNAIVSPQFDAESKIAVSRFLAAALNSGTAFPEMENARNILKQLEGSIKDFARVTGKKRALQG